MINIRNLSRLRLTEYSGTLNLNDLFWFRWISYNKFPLYIRCFENLSLLKQGWVDWLGVIQLMSLLFDSNFFQQVSYYDPAIHLRKKKAQIYITAAVVDIAYNDKGSTNEKAWELHAIRREMVLTIYTVNSWVRFYCSFDRLVIGNCLKLHDELDVQFNWLYALLWKLYHSVISFTSWGQLILL